MKPETEEQFKKRLAEQDALWDLCNSMYNDYVKNVVDLNKELCTLEKQRIQEALAKAEGNQTKAAELLKLGRTTLIAKMRKYGLVYSEA